MRRMLSRLFRRRTQSMLGLEVAHEEWAPVPPAQGAADWGKWLQEEARPAPGAEASAARLLRDEPEIAAKETPESKVQRQPRARRRSLTGERWRELLVACAEHLTDEELSIIKRQMAG